MTLASITTERREEPDRIFLYGVEKVGKSTFGANAPRPVFISSENGLAEISPAPAAFPEVESFRDVLDAIEELTTGEHPFRTVVIDSMDWIAALVQREVCERNKWSAADFDKFGRGHKVALEDWRKLVLALERLQLAKGMEVILIAHAEAKNFDDPLGAPFVRYQPKMGGSVAPALFKEWAKSILFCRHEYGVKEADGMGRNKGVETGNRVIHTTWSAAYDAGSRHGLPPTLPLDYQAYAEARAAGRPASPERLREEIEILTNQLAPTEAQRAWVTTNVTRCGDDAAKLAQFVNVLRTKVNEAATQAAASGEGVQ
jgi:hypothetical protein